MKGILTCPICQEIHEYHKDVVIAFFCPFLDGIIHFTFYTKEEIEKHKKEAEPKSWKNIFKRKDIDTL